MSEARLDVTYDGPALANGSMDVRDLAPALLAVADLVQEANRITGTVARPPRIHVNATERGSFSLHLLVSDGSLFKQAIDLLSGDGATAAANLAGLTAFVTSTIGFTVQLRGRKIRHLEEADGMTTVIFSDGTTVTIPSEVMTAVADTVFRQSAKRVMEPLNSDGIDQIRFTPAIGEPVTVNREQVDAFEIPIGDAEQVLTDETRPAALKIISLAFRESNKWRVSDGEHEFWATVHDLEFLGRVDRDEESFAKSDILRVDLRTVTWETPGGNLRTEHEITRIREHRRGPRQIGLPFEH